MYLLWTFFLKLRKCIMHVVGITANYLPVYFPFRFL